MTIQLASFQTISAIIPHLNADSLELVTVLGWQVVVRKGEFSEGQLIVFLQPDSILPDMPWSTFLKKGTGRIRLKTIRLRGEISQGLILSTSVLGLTGTEDHETLTDLLGITKYSKDEDRGPGFIGGKAKPESTFPTHLVPKTDEERIQNMPWLPPILADKHVFWTEKYDGTSVTFIYEGQSGTPGKRYVCSRNQDLQEDEKSVYWAMYRKYIKVIFDKADEHELDSFAIQGEICGPGINKNPLGLKEVDFFLFNIYLCDARQYSIPARMLNFARVWNLKTVEVCPDIPKTFDLPGLLQFANREYTSENGIAAGKPCEGVVGVVHIDERRVSFKVINNEYKD